MRGVRGRCARLGAVLLCVAGLAAACGGVPVGQEPPAASASAPATGQELEAPRPSSDQAPAAPPLAQSKDPASGLLVQVVDVRRLSPNTVEVTLALSNPEGPSAKPLSIEAVLAADAAAPAGIEGIYLSDPPGRRKYFVLRNAENEAQCTCGGGTLGVGERRVVWLRFGAIPADLDGLVVHVPGLAALRVSLSAGGSGTGRSVGP
ncbi:MAG: hypothetical protein U0Q12_24050 [Vicinamibacterales bacterium]